MRRQGLTIDMIAIRMLIIYRCVIAMVENAIATLLPPKISVIGGSRHHCGVIWLTTQEDAVSF